MNPRKCRNWSRRHQSFTPPASLTSLLYPAVFLLWRKVSADLKIMKTIFAILSLIGMTGTCLGQGTVNWAGISAAVITAQTNTQQWSPLFGGGSSGGGTIGNTAPASSGLVYYYELLYNTNFTGSQVPTPNTVAALFGTWLDAGLMATNSDLAFASGRLTPVNPNFAAAVPWDKGTTNNIMLVGWSANLGTSWAEVANELANWDYYRSTITGAAFFGMSATGYLTPQASGTAPGAAVFATGPTTNGLPIYSPNMQLYWLSPLESGGSGGLTNYPDAALRAALALTNKVVFTFDGRIVLTNTIYIHTNVVLDAGGHQVTISGDHSNRVFFVGSDGDLTLSNLVIADGCSDQGAGVYNEGSVTAINCTFTGSSVVGAAGSDTLYYGAGGVGGSGAGESSGTPALFDSVDAHSSAIPPWVEPAGAGHPDLWEVVRRFRPARVTLVVRVAMGEAAPADRVALVAGVVTMIPPALMARTDRRG